MPSDTPDLTVLLHRISSGDPDAGRRLYELVAPELRELARVTRHGAGGDAARTVSTMVERAYARLVTGGNLPISRTAFFTAMASAIRADLSARSSAAPRSGGPGSRRSHHAGRPDVDPDTLAALIDELLGPMRDELPIECSIVELKCFLGLSDEETADILDLPLPTMRLKWHDARYWLFERASAQGWQPRGAGAVVLHGA